ncbi:MAG: type II secretion system protein [Armatimonadota bacterium]|nr:type II secretion system protein [Armatimonadota bacterium]MDR7613131.1 type II secretion system protein [Armatimonadota bacterium]
MRDQKGLTLIELVAVLAILVILAAAVTFRISASTDAARLRAAAEWTASVVRQAIRLSWTQQTPVRLRFNPGSMDVTVTAWNGTAWVPVADFSPQGFDPPGGAVISGTTYPSHTLTISPAGRGVSGIEAAIHTTEGSVTVTVRDASMLVSTTLYGQVQVSAGDPGGHH